MIYFISMTETSTTHIPPPLSWGQLINLNLFWLGLNIRNNAVGSIFLPYLVSAFVLPSFQNSALGGIRTAGLVIAMLVQPAMGLLSDRSTSKFGKRRPYIFVGVMLDLIFLAALGLAVNLWFLLAAMLCLQFSANVSHGPLQGLIPDLVPEKQRGVASALKAIFELLPLILLGFTIAPLVGAGNFGWAVALTGALLLLVMLLTIWLVKEEPQMEAPHTPLKPEMLRVLGMLGGILAGAGAGLAAGAVVGGLAWVLVAGLWPNREIAGLWAVGLGGAAAMICAVVAGVWSGVRFTLGRMVGGASNFTWWLVNRLMFLAAVTSIQGFAAFFIMYAFRVNREEAAGMTGQLITAVGIATLLSALPAGWLSDRFGQRRLVALSGGLAAAGTGLVLANIWLPNMSLIYLAGAILGLATGLFVTTNWALGTRLVPPEQAGRYLGVSNLAGAGAGIVGSGLGGPIADYLNAGSPGLGYFAIFATYLLLFLLSSASLLKLRDAG